MKKNKLFAIITVILLMTMFLAISANAGDAPRWVLKNMMKTDSTPGIRFCAKVYESLRQDEKLEEYGFIVAACDVLEANGVSVGAFCHESDVKYVSSVNYKASGEEKVDKVFDTEDGIYVVYACVITNIPEKHYRSGIVAKPYIKYDGEITYGTSFRVNYLGAAGNMLKSEEFANLSDEEKALVESVANYGAEEDNEFEIEENPDAEGLNPATVLDEIMTSPLEVSQNIIIPTSIKDVEAVSDGDTEEVITFVYAYVDEEVKYVPVSLDDCCPAIVEDGKVTAEYDEKLCVYTIDKDGIYHIRSLGYAENENGEYIGLEKEDPGILYNEEDENVMFYVDRKENQELYRVVGNRYDVGFDALVTFDENTVIVIRHYDSDKDRYEYVIYDNDTIENLTFKNIDLTYIVSNNPESNSLERCYFLYGITEGDGIVNIPSVEPEPDDPVVPNETVEECGYRIIKSSDPYIDENNYYRNYYTLLNPMTGKTESVPGNLTSATAGGIKNTAMQIGSIVCLKDGMVDDISGAVIDTFDAVQSPRHEIDGGKYKSGLVWITKCDIIDNVIEAYNVADGANLYDTGETVTYGFDSNTAVTVLKHAKANGLVQWGTFGLLTADDLASSKNDYKCYNNKVPTYKEDGSVDTAKPYKTGYAKYIKAYMVTENKQDLEEGELNKAIFVIVVVNEYENLAHLTTNKQVWTDEWFENNT